MGDLFRPAMEQLKANAIEAAKTAIQECWTRMNTEQERANAVVDVQMTLNECAQLQCKPPESQLVIRFLRTMPMDGDWAVLKITWMDSQIATVNEMIEKIRAAELGNEAETTGVRSFMVKPQCKICKKFHGGECRYKNKHRGEHRRNFNDSEKRCFVCGKKGHISFNRPKRKRSGDGSDGSGDSDMDYEAFKKKKRQMKKNEENKRSAGCTRYGRWRRRFLFWFCLFLNARKIKASRLFFKSPNPVLGVLAWWRPGGSGGGRLP